MTENILQRLNMTQGQMDEYVDRILKNDKRMKDSWVNWIELNYSDSERKDLIDYETITILYDNNWIDGILIENYEIY